jgi:hypothetical protein
MANLLLNSATGTRFPIPDLQNRWLGAIPQMNGKPAYAYRVAQEGDVPTPGLSNQIQTATQTQIMFNSISSFVSK